MNIVVGSDHRGFKLKEKLKRFLSKEGHQIIDVGTDSDASTDYPIYAKKVAQTIEERRAQKGLLICGSGIGVCMAVNKFKGIRGAPVRTVRDARMAAGHNNANVVCVGADAVGFRRAKKIIREYLRTEFEGGRHQRRVDMIKEFEDKE